tara:strand:+ start:20 stop:1642 length:1623 start_codon:yes stop_codon:yes gene_type:complete
MSYRNPKIIDDKSGQVLGQAIAQGAENISKGIIGMEAQNRAVKERKEKKDKEDRDKLVLDNKRKAALRADFNSAKFKYQENIKKTFEEFRPFLTEQHEAANQAQYDISVEGQVMGMGGKDFNDKEQKVYNTINGVNSLTTDLIGVSTAFEEYIKAGGTLDENTFWKSYGYADGTQDDGKRTGAIGMAFGGVPDYKAELIKVKEDLKKKDEGYVADMGINIKITEPDGNILYVSQAEFSTMAQNMIFKKDGNAAVKQIDNQTKSFFTTNKVTKKTQVIGSFENSKENVTVVNGNKIETYQRQILNKQAITETRDAVIDKTVARVEATLDQPQALAETLRDFGISEADFNAVEGMWALNSGNAFSGITLRQAQRGFIQDESLKLFNKTNNIKLQEDKDGNVIPDGEMYFDVLTSSKAGIDDESIAKQEFSYYTSSFDSATGDIQDDITNIFEIGGGKEIKMGASRYYPFDMTVNNDGVVTVTKTGKLAMGGASGDIQGGTDTDKRYYNMKDRKDVMNFIFATTPLLAADARALRDQIILKYK